MKADDPLVIYVLGAFLGLGLAGLILTARRLFTMIALEYEYFKNPRLIPYCPQTACDGPHQWVEVSLGLRGLEPGMYQACSVCGAITGNHDWMLAPITLKKMEEGLKAISEAQAAVDARLQRIADLADQYIDKYIRVRFPEELNDADFGQRLRSLVLFSLTAQTAAQEKIEAEEAAQADLDSRYDSWPSKIKGNA